MVDLQHEMWFLTLANRLYIAPVQRDMRSVLDIGCGNGSWVLEMAKDHPTVQIVAADLTPPDIRAPSNVTVTRWDAEKDWDFAQLFTFIHGRMLTSAIRDWPALLSRSWDHLEPGGWLELLDVCPPYHAERSEADDPEVSPFIKWGFATNKAWAANGIDWDITSKRIQKLSEIGFVNLREEVYRWPLGEWASDEIDRYIGKLTLQNFLAFLNTAGPKILGQDPEIDEVQGSILRDRAAKDLEDNCMTHRYFFIV